MTQQGQVAGKYQASRVTVALLAAGCSIGGDSVLMGVFIVAIKVTIRKIAHSTSTVPSVIWWSFW